ncbi:uncharacterized protein E0L32_002591 [Thyridium curvatum]|uniref:Uncharacterized protein n=1 Tax=Thyridium curvatum TaxID=1093900 RepID=A0A507BIX9_9PEZI|nr:uncharacterized protein E0L32_002591 [Thyridium curvatum]TPX18734.1 hypothetical protein E0L32_002591 [Thyridium curvatum]
MAVPAAKTIVATGCTSGLGFELVKQLLAEAQPYHFILGARDINTAQAAYDKIQYDSKHTVTILPVELSDLQTVKSFAHQTLETLGQRPIDYLLLNAGIARDADDRPGPNGSQWCDSYIINHLCQCPECPPPVCLLQLLIADEPQAQHYLIHLLRAKLEFSHSRIVVVSSGAIRRVKETSGLEDQLKAGACTETGLYPTTKFIQLLGAHWWRRELMGKCTVVATSPGLIPGTGIGRFAKPGQPYPSPNHPDAKSVPDGARSILAAFTRDDLPEDPERIFLTSWGEWWPKDVYSLALDRELQNKWCPTKEDIEKVEGIAA